MTNETQTTHIPGPWHLLGRFPGEWAVGPKGEVVVQAFGRDSTEADARLISAAPDLLAVCDYITALSAGWDEDGSLGPREPLSWETVARMAMDVARHAAKEARGQ